LNIFHRIYSLFQENVTVTICPGPLVHSMGKMFWRNDNGEEGFIVPSLVPPEYW